ncbi:MULTISPECIES: WXG100 family type VII secretion target [Streptomyces]|jgi:WXG100 family type VII secretion target|uniref:ESAT-6-like protein n=1 Tax=Streptomyces sp. 900116325 TaxID=3154295 RepID=A0ABV2ULB3_9ACTN|nr:MULTISPECIES: WXG100 family type VII secretion target [unclassified Streptomyces]MDX2733131.1 WXG100 family type VII secretion target [Streptomyces sp. PA03-2a]MDX3771584.1 WXG100 family type VII secretion target [Streptomyces sp. AK08-01B]MDX3821167.1 WXG100 family type VII secretion target [Streptomyces sp. AK08-01A]WSQ26826.1 WXG100 family type VII secretion target [Streptomyces sp. NBC_01230]SCZ17077.1 WXG100 family type VII secretion target [Streptomyces sp. 136MFCol5.1]
MATDPNTKVRYESVQEMANRIRVVSQNIIKDLQEMDAALKVVTDTWDGEAHGEYVHLQSKYKGKAEHMKTRLEHVAKIIESGKDSYRSTDVKASRLFTEGY